MEVLCVDQNTFLLTTHNQQVCLTHDTKFIIVFSTKLTVKDIPFIPLATHYNGDTVFEQILGHLVRKGYNSKYFGQPRLDEHCLNGGCTPKDQPYIISLAKKTKRLLERKHDESS